MLMLQTIHFEGLYMRSSDAKASKCRLKFSSKMCIFPTLLCLGSVISLQWQCIGPFLCNSSEMTQQKYRSVRKMHILKENFRRYLEAFASELFIYDRQGRKNSVIIHYLSFYFSYFNYNNTINCLYFCSHFHF